MSDATPAIEKVEVQPASLTLKVNMNLASIPAIVTGQYNIHSNCFYPGTAALKMAGIEGAKGTVIPKGFAFDLEELCELIGWDYWLTYDQIQQAVENRDH